ncbi:MAG: hypothetical protein EBR87_09985 [Cytophagia bacterium]|nr:hypothetical protein [Cytophagia bacterium]
MSQEEFDSIMKNQETPEEETVNFLKNTKQQSRQLEQPLHPNKPIQPIHPNKPINVEQPLILPIQPIPPNQYSVAGGFFLLHRDKIEWWYDLYYSTLERYFANNYLVKDDQIIIADCVFSHLGDFKLYKEALPQYDNWFMFQRLLL